MECECGRVVEECRTECPLTGTQCFSICLSDPSLTAKSASVSDEVPNLSNIPKEYHNYADVFSKAEASKLPPHRPYDLKITLEGTSPPPISVMYSLSPSKLETLQEFIDENLRNRFIQTTSSPHGAPVLFIRINNGSLQLCVDYRGFNRILKKDRYPLPLISTS